MALNEKLATPFTRSFLTGAETETIDLVPKYDAAGRPRTYIRLFDAELEEPTPVAVYVNYNGYLDFHVHAEHVPHLMRLDGVIPWKTRYVRLPVTDHSRIDAALQLLSETLEIIRES